MYSFIETRLFSQLVSKYLSDEEYAKLQQRLIADPAAGDLIPDSGGIRKLRWKGSSRGKSGGVRVIYYARTKQGEIWMLTLYAKSVSGNIPAHILKKIKEEIDA
ncbi:MAG TPA: transcriptional regulator [Acidobacteriota bacterium]|nr:transcriptional regulator [Acidobacteriota bacterium]